MKVQLEVFLTSVHLRILTLTSSQLSSKKYSANDTAKEELALESLLEFCREPSLMQDLYTNYDCDVQCTNLFDSIISILCVRSIPYGLHTNTYEENNIDMNKNPINMINTNKISILNKLALDGVFAVLHSVGMKCADTTKIIKSSKKISNIKDSDTSIDNSSHSENNQNNTNLILSVKNEKLDNFNDQSSIEESADALVDQWCMGDLDSKNGHGDDNETDKNLKKGKNSNIFSLNDITIQTINSKEGDIDNNNGSDKFYENNHDRSVSIDSIDNYEKLKDSRGMNIQIHALLHEFVFMSIHICMYTYMCMYIYIHVYVYIHTYIYICVHIYIYIYVHICVDNSEKLKDCRGTYICMYIHMCVYTNMCIYIYIYIFIYIYMYVFICIYIYIYICMYI
jgi:hypothetical protein